MLARLRRAKIYFILWKMREAHFSQNKINQANASKRS